MYIHGILKELVLEMRALRIVHRTRLKKSEKEGIPFYDPIVIAPWHKYVGLREFAASLFNVAENRITQIVDNKNIHILDEDHLTLLKIKQMEDWT